VAVFLESVKEKILDTGKYINVFRECGIENKHVSWARNFEYNANERVYIEQVEEAHRNSSRKLLEFLMKDHNFMARLRYSLFFFFPSFGEKNC